MCFFILRIVESESGGHRTPRFVCFDIELPCLHIFHPSHTVCAIALVLPLCKALQKKLQKIHTIYQFNFIMYDMYGFTYNHLNYGTLQMIMEVLTCCS